MKLTIVVIAMFLMISSAYATGNMSRDHIFQSPPDTTKLPTILGLPLTSFIGQPVDSLFAHLPGGYTSRSFFGIKHNLAKGVTQVYYTSDNNNCVVEVYIDTWTHLSMPQNGPISGWSMTQGTKETIAYIKVLDTDYKCRYGCSNPKYFNLWAEH